MKTVAGKLYEGMFLVDSALAASNWQGVNDTIRSMLDRAGAEIVSINKWDERRLAYDIMGKSRGTYILAYFRVDGSKIAGIERSVQLSEEVMRVLVLSVEDVDEQYLAKGAPAMAAQSQAPAQVAAPADPPPRLASEDAGACEQADAGDGQGPGPEELEAEDAETDESLGEAQEDEAR